MRDTRLDRMADIFLTHSLALTKGDGFLVSATTESIPLVKAILRRAADLGVYPVVELTHEEVTRLRTGLFDPAEPEAVAFLEAAARWEQTRWQDLKGRIAIRGTTNSAELAEVAPERMRLVTAKNRPVQDLIVNQRRWVLFDWPTRGMAQKAGMSYDRFFDFTMEVSDLDYVRLEAAERVLAGYLDRADRVRIEGPETDVRFSIAGIPSVCCYGRRNIPDGEVYTAPVLDSVQGVVTYNVPTSYWGRTFDRVRLEFSQGEIVAATCDGDQEALQAILDTDAGARRIGEFSFGVNHAIREPIGNILFDEKIGGSFHLTPGAAYAKADNGNRSAIHWDLISIQRPEYGGGRIWLDETLIREDGLFLPDDLQALNP